MFIMGDYPPSVKAEANKQPLILRPQYIDSGQSMHNSTCKQGGCGFLSKTIVYLLQLYGK